MSKKLLLCCALLVIIAAAIFALRGYNKPRENKINVKTPLAFQSTLVIRQAGDNTVREQRIELPVSEDFQVQLRPEFDTTKKFQVFLFCQYLTGLVFPTTVHSMWEVDPHDEVKVIWFSKEPFTTLYTQQGDDPEEQKAKLLVSKVEFSSDSSFAMVDINEGIKSLEEELAK